MTVRRLIERLHERANALDTAGAHERAHEVRAMARDVHRALAEAEAPPVRA